MKIKIVILGIVFSLFTTNCSQDNEVKEIEKSQDNSLQIMKRTSNFDNLKFEYKKIVESADYLSYKTMVGEFYQKLNLETNINFTDEQNLLNWVNSNISITSFSNYNEAELKLKSIKDIYSKILKDNSTFYTSLNNLNEEQLIELNLFVIDDNVIIGDNQYNTNSGPCENECINDAVDCGRTADQAYASAMAVSASMYAVGLVPAGMAIAAVASINHTAAQHGCVRSLNGCMRGCE